MNFKIGDSVVVKPNVKDPDFGIPIENWQGRISDIGERGNTILIDWDSITMRNMPDSIIYESVEKGWAWHQMNLNADEVELTEPRDTPEDVDKTVSEIEGKHQWVFLGEEGIGIQAVLADVEPDDERGAFAAWEAHLRVALSFPFKARIDEFQERGPLQAGERVIVERIVDIADLYGIIVEIKHERGVYTFHLCDLEATDQESANYDRLREYVVWYANR